MGGWEEEGEGVISTAKYGRVLQISVHVSSARLFLLLLIIAKWNKGAKKNKVGYSLISID